MDVPSLHHKFVGVAHNVMLIHIWWIALQYTQRSMTNRTPLKADVATYPFLAELVVKILTQIL